MRYDILDEAMTTAIVVCDDGGERAVAAIASEVRAAPSGRGIRLVGQAPLGPRFARELFRALAGAGRAFSARLSLSSVEHEEVVEEAAKAGCIAIEVEREGALLSALASGIDAPSGAFERTVRALRRVRGLGIATVAHLPLGRDDDDEGVFERAVRFCRQALIAVPRVTAHADHVRPSPGGESHPPRSPRMDRASLENGLRWTQSVLGSRRAIWRRALWPTGSRRLALTAGYAQRRQARHAARGRYTPTMELLRSLNRTVRARARSRFLTLLARDRYPFPAQALRGAWLHTKAASDERVRALFIEVEGALDLRGARSLLNRVAQAAQAGYQRIVIDVRGLEAVSLDVLTRFVDENRARFREMADRTRLVNLRVAIDALRKQVGDLPSLHLLEVAAAAEA